MLTYSTIITLVDREAADESIPFDAHDFLDWIMHEQYEYVLDDESIKRILFLDDYVRDVLFDYTGDCVGRETLALIPAWQEYCVLADLDDARR